MQLILDGAWVSNLQMQGKNNGVMAPLGTLSGVWNAGETKGPSQGTGQVEQVRAHGKGLYVGTPGTQVIALREARCVGWRNPAEEGSLVISGKGEDSPLKRRIRTIHREQETAEVPPGRQADHQAGRKMEMRAK